MNGMQHGELPPELMAGLMAELGQGGASPPDQGLGMLSEGQPMGMEEVPPELLAELLAELGLEQEGEGPMDQGLPTTLDAPAAHQIPYRGSSHLDRIDNPGGY